MTFGFIILRHVNSTSSNLYWQQAYDCVRKLYPEEPIIMLDDNSRPEFLTEKVMSNTTLVQSEFPGRGELLPYYYFLKNKWFDTAIILHDSVFLHQHIDTHVTNYKLVWEFEHSWDNSNNIRRVLGSLDNSQELLEFYENKSLWRGCFGGMAIIAHDYLQKIDTRHSFAKLLEAIQNREDRMAFERVIACMLQIQNPRQTLLGDIHQYLSRYGGWGYPYSSYLRDKEHLSSFPIIKVWTGR
jgi:hypothetical protein